MFKKIIIIILLLFCLLSLLIFIRPGILINPESLKFILSKSSVLREWSWEEAQFRHEWKHWNDRKFSGHFKSLCLEFNRANFIFDSCLKEVSWDLRIRWSLNDGFVVTTLSPFFLSSDLINITLLPTKETSNTPPEIWKYWKLLWSKVMPNMVIEAKKINVVKDKRQFTFDLKLIKERNTLEFKSWILKLKANPGKIELTMLEEYKLPIEGKFAIPIYLKQLKLLAFMKEKGIPIELTGDLELLSFKINTYLDLPLQKDYLRSILLASKADLEILDTKNKISKFAPRPYNTLPAPLNVMNGTIKSLIHVEEMDNSTSVLIKSSTDLDLASAQQSLKLNITVDAPMAIKTYTPGAISVGVDFEDVKLQLPRLSKKSPPPQFFPDRRFKKSLSRPKIEEGKSNLFFDLEALNDEALQIKTNLLDESLRMNFDLKVRAGEIKEGFVKVLPLKTTVFKRPIRLQNFVINFKAPIDPVLKATIKFPLPEYRITLDLEGPVSDPRYVFTSEPPLPQNDIFAVLLFGRPLSELDTNDKNAATKTNKLLSQGILSLSVLYFLAGSPVEYVGYDPESKNATAQFGLGTKSSLRVGGGREGVNSTAIRRSLGKGWYLDTSVQNSSTPTDTDSRNYGVLLERIIAY